MPAAQTPRPEQFEQLGAFYLGRPYDLGTGQVAGGPLLYDSKDLTTHAVCVGMTGSGKTGLCVSLLEEAALDGIPTLAIDPKGDLGNLLLTFPKLTAQDFAPWIDPDEAVRKGMTVAERAAAVAALWKKGLAAWGQDGARIGKLRDAADFAIYTPGSDAGIPVSVLRSFAAPPVAVRDDGDVFRERVGATVAGLLAMLGIDADPVQSREHVLLANILDHAWHAGRDLTIESLIRDVQAPPFDKVGMLDLETVYPSKDRMGLVMAINNLLASPGFSAWRDGVPLDMQSLLWTQDGRPRIAIISIAHLNDAERMFIVTMLLNEMVSWMRSQSGTTSLRALLYMDEVFGYMPPTANPPSKTPMLTLMKQARAYGVGVVLATQNPVDLDYKGLSNAGTWFLGRLQTERDKLRVLDGLEGASAASGATFDRARVETILSGLASRVFLMNNVHEDAPILFHTRWAMSYLRGPLIRDQIKALMAGRAKASAHPTTVAEPEPAGRQDRGSGTLPIVPSVAAERFAAADLAAPADANLLYRPALLGFADVHYVNARAKVDTWRKVVRLAHLRGAAHNVWGDALSVAPDALRLEEAPRDGARFATLPARAGREKVYPSWQNALRLAIYRDCALTSWNCKVLKLTSTPDENERAFRVRVRDAAHETRDLAIEKLRNKYAPKLARLEERIRKAEARIAREASQYSQQKVQTAISIGATVLGALFGRKLGSASTVGRATTAARGASRAARERRDVARAREDRDALERQLADLSDRFDEDARALREKFDPDNLDIRERAVRPRKADITIEALHLVWLPWWVDDAGVAQPAYDLGEVAS